jgi:TetR/AcrR family transcriptional repressor of nem operon
MEATGLKKGGIYRHFASKEELAAEAFDYTWEAAWKARLLHVDEKANGIDKLKQLIANFIERRSPVPGGCPVLNTAVDADDGNPILRSRVGKALRSWTGRVQAYIEEAQQQRDAKPDVDPKDVATLIVASLEGALMMSRIQRNDEALRRVQSHLNEYLDKKVAVSR